MFEITRDLFVALSLVGLLAWVILKPVKAKEDYEMSCSKAGGVVAFQVVTKDRVCVTLKSDKHK